MLILAVDDDPDMRRLIGRVAAGLGLQIELAATAEEFRASFGLAAPDAVILDLCIAGEDGLELLRFLGAAGFRGQILVMSGLDEAHVQRARELGEGLSLAVAGLTKPVRLQPLREALLRLRPAAAWAPPGDAPAEELDRSC